MIRFLLKHIDKENLRDPESAFLHAAVRVANSNIVMLLFDTDIDVSRVLSSRWDFYGYGRDVWTVRNVILVHFIMISDRTLGLRLDTRTLTCRIPSPPISTVVMD